MKVIFISMDRKMFTEGSAVRKRMSEYGNLFEKVDVIVFSKKSDALETQDIAPNVTIHPTNSGNRWQYMGDAFRIGKMLSADYVSGDGPETSQVAYKIARTLKAKFQLQVHTDIFSPHFGRLDFLNMMRVNMVRQLLAKADSIRVVSKRIADSIVNKKIRTKVAPVVLPIFEENDARFISDYMLPKPEAFAYTKIHFLTVSRIEHEKDMLFLLETFKAVHDVYPDTMLTILGSGSEEEKLKLKVKSLKLDDAVTFVGWTEDTAAYYQHADIYIQTSLYEGFGRSLFEAALSGCAIVSTDVGLIGEILKDGESVIVIDKKKHDTRLRQGFDGQATNKIQELVSDEQKRHALGTAAREAARAHMLSKEDYLAKYKSLFI